MGGRRDSLLVSTGDAPPLTTVVVRLTGRFWTMAFQSATLLWEAVAVAAEVVEYVWLLDPAVEVEGWTLVGTSFVRGVLSLVL